MAVSVDGLLAANGGEMDPALYPSDGPASFEAKVTAWIAEGVTKAAALTDADVQDPAVTHWAYNRFFRGVFIRLSSRAASKTLPDQVSTAYTDEQIRNFKTLADEHLAAFEAAVPSTGTGESLPLRTSYVATNYGW